MRFDLNRHRLNQHSSKDFPVNRYFSSSIVIAMITIGFVAGCGSNDGFKLARVSGVVKVDGKPLKGLRVSFEPIGGAERPYPGPESIGITDDEGHFSLATFNDVHGLVRLLASAVYGFSLYQHRRQKGPKTFQTIGRPTTTQLLKLRP